MIFSYKALHNDSATQCVQNLTLIFHNIPICRQKGPFLSAQGFIMSLYIAFQWRPEEILFWRKYDGTWFCCLLNNFVFAYLCQFFGRALFSKKLTWRSFVRGVSRHSFVWVTLRFLLTALVISLCLCRYLCKLALLVAILKRSWMFLNWIMAIRDCKIKRFFVYWYF